MTGTGQGDGGTGETPWWRRQECRQYLESPVSIPAFGTLLLLFYVYLNQRTDGIPAIVIAIFVVVGVMALLRLSRRAVYAVVLAGMLGVMGHAVLVTANGDQDAYSDRDDAVEIGASALLHGENPWNHKSILGLPITTGPSSLLLAIPFVMTTGHINVLTVLVWTAFLVFLAVGDIRYRNNTLLKLCLLMAFPFIGFLHTWNWSLDELFYPAVLMPVLWLMFKRDRLVWAGVLAAFIALSRLSYLFAVFAIGIWWCLGGQRSRREYARIAAGVALFVLPVLALLLVIGGSDFLHANFMHTAQVRGMAEQDHWLGRLIPGWMPWMPKSAMGNGMLAAALVLAAGAGMRRVPHPFFHAGFAMFLAHTLCFNPGPAVYDYILAFLIPLMYGIAFDPGNAAPATSR